MANNVQATTEGLAACGQTLGGVKLTLWLFAARSPTKGRDLMDPQEFSYELGKCQKLIEWSRIMNGVGFVTLDQGLSQEE